MYQLIVGTDLLTPFLIVDTCLPIFVFCEFYSLSCFLVLLNKAIAYS